MSLHPSRISTRKTSKPRTYSLDRDRSVPLNEVRLTPVPTRMIVAPERLRITPLEFDDSWEKTASSDGHHADFVMQPIGQMVVTLQLVETGGDSS